MVAPYAIRLAVERVEESGKIAGRLYAISTIGSVLGTFTSALLFIPLLGTRRTLLAYALSLAGVAGLGLRRRRALVAGPAGVRVGPLSSARHGQGAAEGGGEEGHQGRDRDPE